MLLCQHHDESNLALVWGLFDIFHWCYEGRDNTDHTANIDVDEILLQYGNKFSEKVSLGGHYIKVMKDDISETSSNDRT